MKKGLILILVLTLTGCGYFNTSPKITEDASSPNPAANVSSPTKGPSISVDDQIKSMTLDEKIGQLVMVGLDGYKMDGHAEEMIRNNVGGFIVLGNNVDNTDQILNLINSLKNANTKNKVPLFVSVDEEGGRVSRMPEEFEKLPTNQEIGALNNPNLSFEIGSLLADEVKSFGYNMDFAPVLDINSNPDNPVIGDRSFGPDANVVSNLGISTMKGIKAEGVISVVKHFPGHGDTSVDSHIGLPSIGYDMKRLKSFELVPFKNAINDNVDAVMIAHILMNQIDSKYPASMSKAVITDILRKQLGFKGLVITDDMTMGAIMQNYDIGDAAVRSINAGSDMVLVCHGYDNQMKVLGALKDAAKTKTISEKRIDESVKRILELKQKYKIKDDTIDKVDISTINQKINKILKYFQ